MPKETGTASHGVKSDTIAARATPAGTGSIAVVRMSGPRALAIAGRVFRPAGHGSVAELHDRVLSLGTLRLPDCGEVIDECLVAVWRAPHSYTGEDVVEFHLHGGGRIVERALDVLNREGARGAAPGEFTRRAFLNGRIDLAQAEAVADLVRAQTDQAARCALLQLGGGLSKRVASLRERLVAVTAEIEAFIDFPDEDLPDHDRARMGSEFDDVLRELTRLLADARRGRPLRDGARVAIAGRPNAGKSSLLNALVGRERAIVAPHPGTTRDTIEAQVDLRGVPTTLVDMAGLRESPETIEALGIERARQEIAAADLVVFLLDGSQPLDASDRETFQALRERPHVTAINKNDLPLAFSRADVEHRFASAHTQALVSVSAVTRDGMGDLEEAMVRALVGSSPGLGVDGGETPVAANVRHIQLLESCAEQTRRASEGLAGRLAFELLAVELREAIESLGAITGQNDVSEDILDAIFSAFCIGK